MSEQQLIVQELSFKGNQVFSYPLYFKVRLRLMGNTSTSDSFLSDLRKKFAIENDTDVTVAMLIPLFTLAKENTNKKL